MKPRRAMMRMPVHAAGVQQPPDTHTNGRHRRGHQSEGGRAALAVAGRRDSHVCAIRERKREQGARGQAGEARNQGVVQLKLRRRTTGASGHPRADLAVDCVAAQ